MKAINFDDANDMILSSNDGKIYQKVLVSGKQVWQEYQYTFYRGLSNPRYDMGVNGDIYLHDEDNIIYERKNGAWVVNNNIDIYFTNEKMSSKDGELGSLNCITAIFEMGPLWKIGSGLNIPKEEKEEGIMYLNSATKRLFLRTSFGDYQIRYKSEKPSQAHSITNAMIFNRDLWEIHYRKSIP